MFFKIDSGLFKFDFIDHHAVLGVPVDADVKDIRKRYLKIARRLHPDTCVESPAEKQRASQLLSKLVNPAYKEFSHAPSCAEYTVLLKEMAKRLLQESAAIELKSELSKQLNETKNIEHVYKTSLSQLAEKQYVSFDQVLQLTGEISELNLVYLIRKGSASVQLSSSQHAEAKSDEKMKAPPPLPAEQESMVEQYLRRAIALIAKNNFVQARAELQDALKLEPSNSRCHSLMGIVYLKQNQITMAKVHINKALQLNPQDPTALEGKRLLDQAQKPSDQPTPKTTQGKQSDKTKGGGLFGGGLFGGKKK